MSLPRLDEFPMSERAPAELEVLSSGHEDVYGLWEIAGGVYAVAPRKTFAHVMRLTQAVVVDLLERGLVELRHGRELQNEASEIVPEDRREAVLADLASWDPHAHAEDDPYYTLTGTPAGIEEYYRQGRVAAADA